MKRSGSVWIPCATCATSSRCGTPGRRRGRPGRRDMRTLLANDLDRVLADTPAVWDDLRDARILLTGGSGFFGAWLLETLLRANERFDLGASVVVVSRDAGAFARKVPHLASDSAVAVLTGDVRTFAWQS